MKLCGYELLGQRDVLQRPEWAAEISRRDHRGSYRATVRPEMVAPFGDGDRVAVQFELTRTSRERCRANLVQRVGRPPANQSSSCTSALMRAAVNGIMTEAAAIGMSEEQGTLGVELADTIRKSALMMFRERRSRLKP